MYHGSKNLVQTYQTYPNNSARPVSPNALQYEPGPEHL